MSLINGIFNRVIFDGDDRQYHYDLTGKIKSIALNIDANTPDCEEKILAFRALQLALMQVDAAMSKKDKYKV